MDRSPKGRRKRRPPIPRGKADASQRQYPEVIRARGYLTSFKGQFSKLELADGSSSMRPRHRERFENPWYIEEPADGSEVEVSHGERHTLPEFLDHIGGVYWPKTAATPAQLKELRRLAVFYVRHLLITWVPGSPPHDLLHEAMGLGKTQGEQVIREARSYDHHCLVQFAWGVFSGMLTGKVAGVLGTPRTNKLARWAFRRIYLLSSSDKLRSDIPDAPAIFWRSLNLFNLQYLQWRGPGKEFDQ